MLAPVYISIRIKYNKFIKKFKFCLTKKEEQYSTKFEVKQSNFYGLPKVHKSKWTKEACEKSPTTYVEIIDPDDLTLRPIIAGPTSQTHRLSNLLDILLRPLTNQIKRYLHESTDFLNKLPKDIPPETLLVSFDIVTLYSNILQIHILEYEAIVYQVDSQKILYQKE